MNIGNMKVNEFLDDLRSSSPAPGGGASAALTGANGAALIMMVTELTIGKEKYREYEEICKLARANVSVAYANLIEAADHDMEAYHTVAAARKLPNNTDEEKAARKKAIADATDTAALVPLKIMNLCIAAMKQLDKVTGHSNPFLESDLVIGYLSLKAALESSWVNVRINLPGMGDEHKKEEYENSAKEVLKEAEDLEKILEEKLGFDKIMDFSKQE